MKSCFSRPLCLVICLSWLAFPVCGNAQAPKFSRPLNLDSDLYEGEPDLAASYYHYALAKWNANNNKPGEALSEMRTALQYNPDSATLHVEMAILIEQSGNTAEAIRYATEGARLDPNDPAPHWFLAGVYFNRRQERERGSREDNLRKAIQELETLQRLTPENAGIYFNLGNAWIELGDLEKSFAAYEKYSELSDSDAGYWEIARYYERVGDLDKMIEYLNKGLAVQPDSLRSLVALGNIYIRQNKSKDAAQVYKKLLGASNNNVQVVRELAILLFDAGEYEEAAAVVEDLFTRVNPDRTSQLILGRSYMALNRRTDAVKTLKEVVSRDPGSIDARFYLGQAYVEVGQYRDAVEIYQSLLNDADHDQDARAKRPFFQQNLASVYLELEEYDKAIAIYVEMAKADPQRNNPLLLNAYRISKQYDKALALGKTLAEASPNDIHIVSFYAKTLADAGKSQAGVKLISDLLESHPDEVSLYVYLSDIYRQDKRFSDAEKILLRGEDRNKNTEVGEQLKFQRAAIYEKQKDYARAEKLFKEILKTNPENANVLNYLGYMLADRGVQLNEALEYIKDALKSDPENGAYLDSLGWAYFKLNDLENAEKYLLQAERFSGKDATIHDHLGDLYFKMGNPDKARDFWTRAIALGSDPEETQETRRKLERVQKTTNKKNAR